VDLSSPQGEENPIHHIARGFEFAQHLFGELNCTFLGPPGDGKVIILNDSDEKEEEACEEKSVGTKDVTASAAINQVSTLAEKSSTPAEKSSTPAASPIDADNDPRVGPNDSSDSLAPGLKVEEGTAAETKPTHLRLPRQERHPRHACFKESYIQHHYPSSSFVQWSWDGDAGLWLTLMPFMPTNYFCSFLCLAYVLDVVLDST
jgi:hypothetical protein